MHILHKPSPHERQVRQLVSEAFEVLITRAKPEDIQAASNALGFLNDFAPRTYRALLGCYLVNDIVTTIKGVAQERRAA